MEFIVRVINVNSFLVRLRKVEFLFIGEKVDGVVLSFFKSSLRMFVLLVFNSFFMIFMLLLMFCVVVLMLFVFLFEFF